MKSLRPFRSLLVAIMALALTVSGCAIKTSDGGSSDSGGSGGAQGTTTLTFWNYYKGTQLTWLQQQTKAFEAKNPNVKINLIQTVGDQQDQKLLASVATGKTPDLFINNIVVDFPTLVAGGAMLDLSQYWNSYADKSKFPDSAVWSQDSKVYNLMSYTNLLGMFYNKDILDEYNIQPPTTLDELTAAMKKVKAGGKYQGMALSGAPTVEGAWLFAPQFLGQGANYCNIDANSPKVESAFQRVAGWRSDNTLPRAAATWDQNAAWQQFMTGKYAFGMNGNWQLGNVKDAKFKYGTVEFPSPPNGKSQVFPGGEGFAIGAKTKHADLAWKFMSEALLSASSNKAVYTSAGSIPLRSDVADSPELQSDTYAKPFVAAAQGTASWPKNPQTATMQKVLGTAVSAVISGQQDPAAATKSAVSGIDAARQKGGGGCE